MCIAKKDTVKPEPECKCDDMMWVDWKGVKVAGVYFVPPSSPFSKRNAKRMSELQQRILGLSEKKIIVLTDANAWIGEEPSVITNSVRGEEVTKTFVRTSERKETNTQGEWFLSEMNNVDMIVLNGVKSVARCTYDHPGREARSVVDFVVVNEQVFKEVSDVSYADCRESLCTDHLLLSIQIQYVQQARTRKSRVRQKKKKSAMEILKTVTRVDGFWQSLESECKKSLAEFDTILGQTVNEDYETFKMKLTDAVSNALKNNKPSRTSLKARLKSDEVIVELRMEKSRLFRAMKAEDNVEKRQVIKEQLWKTNKKLKLRTRKAINEFKTEQVKEIERLEANDCRRMWKELKTLAGWESKDRLPETVLDVKGHEVCGNEVAEVWKEAFQALGKDDEEDAKFDRNFREEILRNEEKICDSSFDSYNHCPELDEPIDLDEVQGAVLRLKLAKAPGSDGIVAEVLKRGGEQVASALHSLCAKVWRQEALPTDWSRGIIFPILKSGNEKDPSNYRGITLLSIVGKVYAQVLNERLMRWCERHKILTEEQGGFRPSRGCIDQLFSLVEILRNRGKQGTFCCFIDVKKAFDRVFRAGLWQRLAEVGVRGKMWRVVKSIYENVESCVAIAGQLTDWFSIETGVRQGCVLSPLLYALFIDGLVKELKALGRGIEIENGRKLCCLLYADDIVLIAESKQNLQRMLDKVSEYAKKWRFELNPSKSQVVVFGKRQPPRTVKWRLGDNEIQQVSQYKYLGIELTRTLRWNVYVKRILAKAKRNMTQALAMGISGGFMNVRLANIIWMSLVRSLIEYGCEIWGDGEFVELEKLQVAMGKRILRCGSRMTEEVVRGELGWERHKARRDEMRLRYWGKIVRMSDDRIPKIIYKVSRHRLEQEEADAVPFEDMTRTWCTYTRKLLKSLHLETQWNTETVGSEEEWNKLIRERIHEREEIKWRARCLMRPKLRTYCKLKKELRFEPYLAVYHRGGVPELAKIRGGTNRLRVEQGRYLKEALAERVCRCCNKGEVEDECHFMLECTAYDDLRDKMWTKFEEATGVSRTSFPSKEEKLNALIGDRFQPSKNDKDKNKSVRAMCNNVIKLSMSFITTAMQRRRALCG